MKFQETLSKYFNKEAFLSFGGGAHAIFFTACTVFNLSSGSGWGVAAGLLTGVVGAACLNKWQEKATGAPLWKPRIWKDIGL